MAISEPVFSGGLVAAAGADGLAHLTGHELGEGLGDELHGERPELGQQHGGVGEQEIAGENGGGIVPATVGGFDAATHGRLVHHIVVVQRGEVDHLAHDGGLDQPLGVGSGPELPGQQGHERTEALATGGHEVQGHFGEEVLPARQSADQQVLDLVERGPQVGREGGVTDVHARHGVVGRPVRGAGRH